MLSPPTPPSQTHPPIPAVQTSRSSTQRPVPPPTMPPCSARATGRFQSPCRMLCWCSGECVFTLVLLAAAAHHVLPWQGAQGACACQLLDMPKCCGVAGWLAQLAHASPASISDSLVQSAIGGILTISVAAEYRHLFGPPLQVHDRHALLA